MRDGSMKWLEIDGNRFLFDLAADPLERANLKERHLMMPYGQYRAEHVSRLLFRAFDKGGPQNIG